MSRYLNYKLLSRRMELMLTEREAAELIGVSVKTYQAWEAGTKFPHISNLRVLCEKFGKTRAELGF